MRCDGSSEGWKPENWYAHLAKGHSPLAILENNKWLLSGKPFALAG